MPPYTVNISSVACEQVSFSRNEVRFALCVCCVCVCMQILGALVCARSAHFGLEQLVSYCFVPRHRTQNQGEAPSLCTQELPKPGQDWTQGKRIKCSTIYSIVRGVNAIYSARKRPSKLEMMWQTRKDEARKWHVNLMPEWYKKQVH